MNRTIGILAHVDCGKTTLSEQLLYRFGAIRAAGRVDAGNTVMDYSPVEQARGITVFAEQARFTYEGCSYDLIDTPGHADFSAEVERALPALDAAMLLVDGTGGVSAHCATLYRLAREQGVPMLLLVNKADRPAFDAALTARQVEARLGVPVLPIEDAREIDACGDALCERAADLDDALLETYLSGHAAAEDLWAALGRIFVAGRALIAMNIAALPGTGIESAFAVFHRLAARAQTRPADADALVYKIRRDKNGSRVTFIKLSRAALSPRDAFCDGETAQKVNELRVYRGGGFASTEIAPPGSAVGATGLAAFEPGDRFMRTERGFERVGTRSSLSLVPALRSRAVAPSGVSDASMLEKLRLLEEEDPALSVRFDPALKALSVDVMGPIQIEILTWQMRERFGIAASFERPEVLYKETIARPVVGHGHYEPLRHYAEVHLRIEPGAPDSGVTFRSECHVDDLALNWQRLIETNVLEKPHVGVLCGCELTDVAIVLLAGRAHLKHTEGGDFRQAARRAVRQGLMKAESVLLEPWYAFEIRAPKEAAGRILSDITRLSGTFEPPETGPDEVAVQGAAPVAAFMDYPKELAAATKGAASVALRLAGYRPCHNAQEIIAARAYDIHDPENPSGSVFCAHGAGYAVDYREAERLMHIQL